MSEMKFKISSALKNLIGKELITDKYVAIFELVKNAYDAGATEAKITFEADKEGHCTKIIIEDDGCGMDADDLRDKWLFVGFSEKRQRAEHQDYRNQLGVGRKMAGAKGVGRFSCDRLGQCLRLISKKKEGVCNELCIDWGSFEEDSHVEFSTIPVQHHILKSNIPLASSHGTYLEVTALRDDWYRRSILELKGHLMKLINPISSHESEFSITIHAAHEQMKDNIESFEQKIVNGVVRNFVFENLCLKTTGINVQISPDGKTISTSLTDRGKRIYTLEERNARFPLLKNIAACVYQLNQSAKKVFLAKTGINAVNFGSIFVYKNGFRIYPYGEPGDDSLGIDRRKQQGYNRYFGTREVIGRLELWGEQDSLQETTSRSGGIVKNDTYDQLCEFFTDFALKRLEKYAVNVVNWGELTIDVNALSSTETLEVSNQILSIISNLSNSDNVISVHYDEDFLSVLKAAQSESAARLPEDLLALAKAAKDKSAARKLRAAAANIKTLAKARKNAEKQAAMLQSQNEVIKTQLEQKNKQVFFLNQIANPNVDNLLQSCHSIIIYSNTIENWVNEFQRCLKDNNSKASDYKDVLAGISIANQKILTLSRFITKANFNATARAIEGDIVAYIIEYFEQILKEVYSSVISFKVVNHADSGWQCKYNPMELGMALENITSNSIKSGAKSLKIIFENQSDHLKIDFVDDGRGISDSVTNLDDIFQKGYTTTDGSGLGLYQVSKCLKTMGAKVGAYKGIKKGAIIRFIF